MLINSLLAHASDERWEEFIASMEALNLRKAVVVSPSLLMLSPQHAHPFIQRLMSSHTIEDLTSCILDFQANWIRVVHRKKMTMPDPDTESSHAAMFKAVWHGSKLEEDVGTNGETAKWRKLGFASEDVVAAFQDVGLLGLECLV